MSLLDRLRAESPFTAPWHPQAEGEGVEGTLVSIETRQGRSAYPVLVIGTESGRVSWHAAGDIAAEQLEQHTPRVGDRIAVLYGGEARSRAGNTYKRWAIAVEHHTEPARTQVDGDGDTRRAEIITALNGIADAECRHRAKRTFARLFGQAPLHLKAELLDDALTWAQRASQGSEQLDPIQ